MADEKLVWHTEKKKVNELIPYEQNPRQMTEDQVEQLKRSLEKFNLVEIPAVDTDNKIIAGHQRLRIMKMIGRGDEEIEVRIPNRKLTDAEFKEYNLRSNRNTGEWNFDILGNSFDLDMLKDVGFSEKELGVGDLFEPVDVEEQGKLDEFKKIKCPECGYEFEPKKT